MRTTPRRRRYVASWALSLLGGLAFRYSPGRDAYVLRIVGRRAGPVLREDRRRRRVAFDGHDRRHVRGRPAG